jgi:hypothetical protein
MNESNIFGMSVRSVLILILTVTVCYMSLVALEVKEPLYSAFMLGLGFYFGQKTAENKNGGTNEKSNSKSDLSGGAPANIG